MCIGSNRSRRLGTTRYGSSRRFANSAGPVPGSANQPTPGPPAARLGQTAPARRAPMTRPEPGVFRRLLLSCAAPPPDLTMDPPGTCSGAGPVWHRRERPPWRGRAGQGRLGSCTEPARPSAGRKARGPGHTRAGARRELLEWGGGVKTAPQPFAGGGPGMKRLVRRRRRRAGAGAAAATAAGR
jgi:hypothetical protein